MGMAAILFNEKLAIPFQQKAPCEIWRKLLMQFHVKKTFKNYTILYMYIAQGKG